MPTASEQGEGPVASQRLLEVFAYVFLELHKCTGHIASAFSAAARGEELPASMYSDEDLSAVAAPKGKGRKTKTKLKADGTPKAPRAITSFNAFVKRKIEQMTRNGLLPEGENSKGKPRRPSSLWDGDMCLK